MSFGLDHTCVAEDPRQASAASWVPEANFAPPDPNLGVLSFSCSAPTASGLEACVEWAACSRVVLVGVTLTCLQEEVEAQSQEGDDHEGQAERDSQP